MATLKESALQVAITQLGKEEEPRGSNWGESVKTYLASVGINFPASWCMAFVYWCFKCISDNPPLVKTGGVMHAWNTADRMYRVTKPEPGDIFIMDFGNGTGHTGFVESVEGDIVHTIEGNTNDTGSREGYEVCRRVRKISKIKGFLRYN